MKELMEYYIKRSDKRFDKLETKIDNLNAYKWKMIGFSGGIVIIFSAIGLFVKI